MSESSIKLSPSATFSYHWNKGIDSNKSCFSRCGESIKVFFKTLFFEYTVDKVEVETFFKSGHHGNSILFKECSKKNKKSKHWNR